MIAWFVTVVLGLLVGGVLTLTVMLPRLRVAEADAQVMLEALLGVHEELDRVLDHLVTEALRSATGPVSSERSVPDDMIDSGIQVVTSSGEPLGTLMLPPPRQN